MEIRDDQYLEFTCRKCSFAGRQHLGQVKSKNGYTCPHCKEWIELSGKELSAELETFEKNLRDSLRGIWS